MTLHSLIATYNHPEASKAYEGCYSYDDSLFGLVAEPLVHDATHAILCAMAAAGLCTTSTPPPTIKLDFTNNTFSVKDFSDDDLVIELTYDSYSDDDFNMYTSTVVSPDTAALDSQIADDFNGPTSVPLCNHLMDYFIAPPKTFWVRVTIPELS
jgi:hypothetical protein